MFLSTNKVIAELTHEFLMNLSSKYRLSNPRVYDKFILNNISYVSSYESVANDDYDKWLEEQAYAFVQGANTIVKKFKVDIKNV